MNKNILSGMRPTGPLHIGHLSGRSKTGKHCRTKDTTVSYDSRLSCAFSTEYASMGKVKEMLKRCYGLYRRRF